MTPTRRGFLLGLTGVIAAPALPSVVVETPVGTAWPTAQIAYPDVTYAQWQYSSMLRSMLDEMNSPRARWKREWRRQRMERRGVVEQTPSMEIGVVEGIRFIG